MLVNGLVLASSSKWRLDLLKQIQIIPELVVSPDVDESVFKGEKTSDYSKRVAIKKVNSVFEKMPDKVILGADTIAALGRTILGKPSGEDEARKWLNMLSGRRHYVYTTVCVRSKERAMSIRQVKSIIKFKRLSDQEIERYISSKDWCGKAGGYGINSLGAVFIKWMQGSSSAIAGLPLCETRALLDNYIK